MNYNALIPELSCTSLTNSLQFYTLLGFTIEYTREEEGFAFISLGKAQLMLDQINKGRTWKTSRLTHPLGRGINLQIQVKSILPLLNTLKKAKYPLFLEAEEKWYQQGTKKVGNKQFLVQDPDGYLLRFFENIKKK